MAKDNNAIDRIKANQNRIQTPNFTPSENEFFNEPSNIGKYEETEAGAEGEALGEGSTSKKGLNLLKNAKKFKLLIPVFLIMFVILAIIITVVVYTNEDLKGFFLTNNSKPKSNLNGSTSGGATPSGTKTDQAEIAKIYKSTSLKNESFFNDLRRLARNYNSYILQDKTPLVDGEFDVAMVAATVHYNKFVSDATILGGRTGARSYSNMGVANSRRMTTILRYELKSFYELAAITLGTDQGIPEEQFRGISGHLVGSRVVSACVTNPEYYLSSSTMSGYDQLDSIIIRYENLYYSGTDVTLSPTFSATMKSRLDDMRADGTFKDYYDTSKYNPGMTCASGTSLVHYVQKYMNYKTYAKYLLSEYVPENYIECVDCKVTDKRTETIGITKAIFDSRNEFVGFYYDKDDIIDIEKFSNGDTLTTTKIEYQLPNAVKENFTSPFGLTTSCTISSEFTANRSGYSHYAVDAYATDRTLYSVYDGTVVTVVSNVGYSLPVSDAGVCLDSNGNIDNRSSGNFVVVEHTLDGKTYRSYYMHMASVNVVPGQKVSKGEKIGVEGSTGCSTGYHVHFQLSSTDGTKYDPTLLFSQCKGASVITYNSQTMTEYLNSIYPNYYFTNQDECIVQVYDHGKEGTYSSMSLEQYAAGVSNHEVSAGTQYESIKAQVIAARGFYLTSYKFCKKSGIATNSEAFQTYERTDTAVNPTDAVHILAARETAGMVVTYAHGLLLTQYSSFPCEMVYRCENPYVFDEYGNLIDEYEPWYLSDDTVTCKSKYHGSRPNKVIITNNPEKGSSDGARAGERCSGNKGSFYYCDGTKYPRQFRNQPDIKFECTGYSVTMKPTIKAGEPYNTIAIPVDEIEGKIHLGETYKEDFSNYYGHHYGISQVLSNYYAKTMKWDYKKILSYFYDNNVGHNLINIDTPTILLDDITEYEANDYNGRITMNVGGIKIMVPVDFYVAGMLYNNFGTNANQTLLRSLAVSTRTWAYNKTLWGHDILDPEKQYAYTYTDSKTIYDAVNATKNTLLVDGDGYITPSEYNQIGSNGKISTNGKEKTITYELGYQYSTDTHKVMIKYDENLYKYPFVSGNKGIVYDVASYMANNWYFVNHHEILKFFYGEDYTAIDIDSMKTKGDSKDENGNIIKYQGGTIRFTSGELDALNADLEDFVNENGYGTMDGVVAAAYWLWRNTREDGTLDIPYRLGGKYPYLGVNPLWGRNGTGLDCTGFLYWALLNGGKDLPGDSFGSFAGMPSYLARMGLLNDEYAIQFESGSVKHRNISLKEYIEDDKIKPGDVLWHHSKTVYSNNSTPSQFAHVALVTEVNKEKGTVTIIHCTGSSYNNQGLVKQEISVNSSFTWLYRFTNLERDGLY